MRVLSLDLGTKTGWALNLPNIGMESGIKEFRLERDESPGMRWIRFRVWLRKMLADYSPEIVTFERPHHRGGAATHVLVNMAGLVEELCAACKVEHKAIASSELKRHMTGKGNVGKKAMIAAAKDRWPDQVIEDDNQADALCVLAWTLDTLA